MAILLHGYKSLFMAVIVVHFVATIWCDGLEQRVWVEMHRETCLKELGI